MKAIVYSRFGSPDVLELREIDRPTAGDGEVLVRVRAASVNPADWYLMTGEPWVARAQMGLRGPRTGRVGVDLAGVVEAVGGAATRLRVGDEVFGAGAGTLAECVAVPEASLVLKPAGLSFEQAAAVPVAALTALQGLRGKGRLQPGQRVLINGASGGVGTFADRVVDYTQEDFTRTGRRYDLLLDVAGSRSWPECVRVLDPRAALVLVGAPKGNRLLGPVSHIAKVRLASLRASQKAVFFISKASNEDLMALLEEGTIRPVVERSYPLGEAADALRYLGEGHARGKLVVTI